MVQLRTSFQASTTLGSFLKESCNRTFEASSLEGVGFYEYKSSVNPSFIDLFQMDWIVITVITSNID
jgi:hypothetical protein